MKNTDLQARITATKALIDAYEAASLALAAGAQSYTLDTGQSRQTVTKFDLKSLDEVLDRLYSRCAILEARLSGGGATRVLPGW